MKQGKGLYVQLSTESQEKLNEMWRKRQLMSNEEKAIEMVNAIKRGIEMFKEAFISIQQDENVKFINRQL